MIDTVILKIPRYQIEPIDEKIWQAASQSAHNCKWIRNMTPEEKKHAIYRPRITGLKRTGQLDSIKIEFSCPKIMFGNNLNELEPINFPSLVTRLQENLSEMGIKTSEETIKNAEVLAFHPSKNFQLLRGYTPSYILKEFHKINIKKIFDFNKTDFRNDGQSLQIYSNTHSLVFYDKIADLNRPKKRAIDRDQTIQQLNLFVEIQNKKPGLEILRMEVRLCNKRKIDSLLKKLRLPLKPAFQDLFKNNLCQKVLIDYWEAIQQHNAFIFTTTSNPHQILNNLIRGSPKIKLKETLYLVGLWSLAKHHEGLIGLRKVLEKSYSRRSWQRVCSDLKKLNSANQTTPIHGWVNQINKDLQEFKPFLIK